MVVRLSEHQLKELDRLAARRECTRSEAVREAVDLFLLVCGAQEEEVAQAS